MKLFERTGGYWLFYISVAYLLVGVFSIYHGVDLVWAGPLYIFFLAMPFWFPPLGRSINLDVTWDQKMRDFFKNKSDNVIKFPEPTGYLKVPEVAPPEPEKPAKIFYRIGVTDNNRVSFNMGHSEITMTKLGTQNLIDQLTVFMNQLPNENDNDSGT